MTDLWRYIEIDSINGVPTSKACVRFDVDAAIRDGHFSKQIRAACVLERLLDLRKRSRRKGASK